MTVTHANDLPLCSFAELDDAGLIAAGQIVAALVLEVNTELRRRQAQGGKWRGIGSSAVAEPQRSPPMR